MSIYRCYVHDIIWKFAKFLSVKNKAYDKRFPYIAILFSSPCPTRSSHCMWFRREWMPPFAHVALADATAGNRT